MGCGASSEGRKYEAPQRRTRRVVVVDANCEDDINDSVSIDSASTADGIVSLQPSGDLIASPGAAHLRAVMQEREDQLSLSHSSLGSLGSRSATKHPKVPIMWGSSGTTPPQAQQQQQQQGCATTLTTPTVTPAANGSPDSGESRHACDPGASQSQHERSDFGMSLNNLSFSVRDAPPP